MKTIKVIVTSIVIITFITQNISWAYGNPSTNLLLPTPQGSRVEFNDFHIPDTYGSIIKKRDLLDSRKPLLFIIEDAHCISKIQMNIANIIKYLVNNYNLKKVCLEGATERVDTGPFKVYPDKNKRVKVMKHYLEEGVLNGVEFLSITEGKDISFEIEGVEDESLYLKNLYTFRRHYSQFELVGKILDRIHSVLQEIKDKYYNLILIEIDNKNRLFEAGDISINKYLEWIWNLLGPNMFYENGWVQAYLTIRAMRLEDKIDFNIVEGERSSLIDYLLQSMPSEDKTGLVNKMLLFKLSRCSAYCFYEYLLRKSVAQYSIDIRGQYPNLSRFIRLLYLEHYLDYTRLEEEITQMKKKLFHIFCKLPHEKEIWLVDEWISLWDKFLRLRINNKELQRWQELQEVIGIDGVFSCIDRYSGYRDLIRYKEVVKEWMNSSEEFYKLAKERDSVIVKNIDKIAKGGNDRYIALVVGGFHSYAIQKQLARLGYPFIVITPHIVDKPDLQKYLSVMLSPKIHIDPLRFNIPPPVVTSSLGKRITDFIYEIASTLVSGVEYRYVLMRCKGLPSEDKQSLKNLFNLARKKDSAKKFANLLVELYRKTRSPTLRDILWEIADKRNIAIPIIPESPEVEEQSQVQEGSETDYDLFEMIWRKIWRNEFNKFQWISFAIFLAIIAGLIACAVASPIFAKYFIENIYSVVVIVYSVPIILKSFQNIKYERFSLKDTISQPEVKGYFNRLIRHPLFWLLCFSLLLITNAYLYEGITAAQGPDEIPNWSQWFFLFEEYTIVPPIIRDFIIGKINDILAIPFVVYSFLTVVKLYSDKLYKYLNRSIFKPLLILSSGVAFIWTELDDTTTTDNTNTINYKDVTDVYAYLIVMGVMILVYIIKEVYNYYIKKERAITLNSALLEIQNVRCKKSHIISFFLVLPVIVYLLYFIYHGPFLHAFDIIIKNFPTVISVFVSLPILFKVRSVFLKFIEKKTYIPWRKKDSSSFTNVLISIFLILFSGICLLVRYLYRSNGLVAIIIISLPLIASLLTISYYSHKGLKFKLKRIIHLIVILLVALAVGISIATYLIGIRKSIVRGDELPSSGLISVIFEFFKQFEGFFGYDISILFGFITFIITFIITFYISKYLSKEDVIVTTKASGDESFPNEAVNDLIKWIGEKMPLQKETERVEAKEAQDVSILIKKIPMNLEISEWQYSDIEASSTDTGIANIVYKAEFRDDAILIKKYLEEKEIGVIRIYALRQKGQQGELTIWIPSSLYDSISGQDAVTVKRQIILHELAESIFNSVGSNKDFCNEFIRCVGNLNLIGIDNVYTSHLKEFLTPENLNKYFGQNISGHRIAELVERLDTALGGSKRYYMMNTKYKLDRLDKLVKHSDLDWFLFYRFLTNSLKDTTIRHSDEVREVFEECHYIYIEGIMNDFVEDPEGLKNYLEREGVWQRIVKGQDEKINKFQLEKQELIRAIKYVLFTFWGVSVVFFIMSISTKGVLPFYIFNTGLSFLCSVILTIYYVFIYRDKESQEVYFNFWERFKTHPFTKFLLIVGLLMLNQYIFNAIALFYGDTFKLPFLQEGWFNVVKDETIFKPMIDIFSKVVNNMPALMDIFRLSILRVNAFLELPFALYAYLSIVRLLNRDLYNFINRSWFMPLAIFSFTITLSLIELFFENPYTESDLFVRGISLLFFFSIFILKKLKDVLHGKKVSFPHKQIESAPHKGFNLGVFIVGVIGVAAVILETYHIALLYNLSYFSINFLYLLLCVSTFIYIKPFLMRIYERLRIKIFVVSKGPRNFNAVFFNNLIMYFLLLFFVPSLFIRYFMDTWIGLLTFLSVLGFSIGIAVYKLKEQNWSVEEIWHGVISMISGATLWIIPNIVGFHLILPISGVEGFLLNGIINISPIIFISIGIESIIHRFVKRKTRRPTRQVSKTRKGQEAVNNKVGESLINWIEKNNGPCTMDGVFQIIPSNISFSEWKYTDEYYTYTAEKRNGEIRLYINDKNGNQRTVDIQAIRDEKNKIWITEEVYNAIKDNEAARRQLILHELVESIYQDVWIKGKDKEPMEIHKEFLNRVNAYIISNYPDYTEELRGVFNALLSYEKLEEYFVQPLGINHADRIGEIVEKIDTLLLGSYKDKGIEYKDIKDIDVRVKISDLDWILFYAFLKESMGDRLLIPSDKLREKLEGVDVDKIMENLDEPEKIISVLEEVSNGCDTARDSANIEDAVPIGNIALAISDGILKNNIIEDEIEGLIGTEMMNYIKDHVAPLEVEEVWSLIKMLYNQIIKIEEKDGSVRLSIDNFSYLLTIELEKELGLEKFELVNILIRSRIFDGLVENYGVEEGLEGLKEFKKVVVNGTWERGKEMPPAKFLKGKELKQDDPYRKFIVKENENLIITVADLMVQVTQFRFEQGNLTYALSDFRLRVPDDPNVLGRVKRIISKVVDGIGGSEGNLYDGEVNGGIKDDLGDPCIADSEMATHIVSNFALQGQVGKIGEIKETLKSLVYTSFYEFSNEAFYEKIANLFESFSIREGIEVAVLDFERCFEIVEEENGKLKIIPKVANLKGILQNLSYVKNICFASMNSSLIDKYGDKILYILSKTYRLNELRNVNLNEVFTGSIDDIANGIVSKYGQEALKSTVFLSSDKNEDEIRKRDQQMPFKVVVANSQTPLSFALGMAILVNSLTDRDTIKKYLKIFNIEESECERVINEAEKTGFILFILPKPKSVSADLNLLPIKVVTINVSA